MSTARKQSGQAMFRYDSPRSICDGCGGGIAKLSKYDSPLNPWLHEHNYSAKCPPGETFAAPLLNPIDRLTEMVRGAELRAQ